MATKKSSSSASLRPTRGLGSSSQLRQTTRNPSQRTSGEILFSRHFVGSSRSPLESALKSVSAPASTSASGSASVPSSTLAAPPLSSPTAVAQAPISAYAPASTSNSAQDYHRSTGLRRTSVPIPTPGLPMHAWPNLPRSIRNAPPELHGAIRRRQNIESSARRKEREIQRLIEMREKSEKNELRIHELRGTVERLTNELLSNNLPCRERSSRVKRDFREEDARTDPRNEGT